MVSTSLHRMQSKTCSSGTEAPDPPLPTQAEGIPASNRSGGRQGGRLTRVVRVPPVCERDQPSSQRASPWLLILRSSSLHIEPRNPVLLRPEPGPVFCFVRSWLPSPSPISLLRKKACHESGAKLLSEGACRQRSEPSNGGAIGETTQTIGGKLRTKRGAELLVSLSRTRHERMKKSPAGPGLSWSLEGACRVMSEAHTR
jgi:hypothetical protein